MYARDHWMAKGGTDENGDDLMSQIPRERVVRVDRNVQRFEDQAQTVRYRVESFFAGPREKQQTDVGEGIRDRPGQESEHHPQSQTIPGEDADWDEL